MSERIGHNPENEATRRRARGVTLIEVMLAASILALMVLSLFEGIAVAARIAHENAEYLQADAYAFDLAWKRYNESYTELRKFVSASAPTRVFPSEDITEEAAPMLYRRGAPAKSYTVIRRISDPDDTAIELGVLISVDVEWGKAGSRYRRSGPDGGSNYGKWITVFKGGSEDG